MGSRSRSGGVRGEREVAILPSRTRSGRILRPAPPPVADLSIDSDLEIIFDSAVEINRGRNDPSGSSRLNSSNVPAPSASTSTSSASASIPALDLGPGPGSSSGEKDQEVPMSLPPFSSASSASSSDPASTSVSGASSLASFVGQEPGILSNMDWSNCGFCGSSLAPQEGVLLDMCLHNFCRQCLIDAITVTDDQPRTSCPIAEETRCGGVISDREIKALIGPDLYDAYVDRSLKTAMEAMQEDIVACLNPNCAAFYSLENAGAESFKCTGCGALNCMKCKEVRNAYGHCSCTPKSGLVDPAQGQEWAERWRQVEESLNSFGGNELLLNTMQFECRICFTDISPGDGVILRECFHMFCRDCLAGTIKHCEDVRIKCPHQVNDCVCSSYLTSQEVKGLLPEDEFLKFLQRSSTRAEMTMQNSYHCKTVNCTGWCEVDEEDRKRTKFQFFQCPVCQKNNCLDCKAVHESVTCQEYQQQLQENEMDVKSKELIQKNIQKGLAMRCPTCKVIIEKTGGCDSMICATCKTEICWATKGPRWGPRGRGDTSGGCRCMMNGVRCHPKCSNCH